MRLTSSLISRFLLITLGMVISFSQPAIAESKAPTKYEQVLAFMKDLVAQYPQNASLFELGVNDAGEKIMGLKVGSGPVKTLVVGTHHGNEYGSTEVTKGFAASAVARPLKDQTTYIIPVLNIWGYNRGSRYEWANNRNNDPNRDYPGPCGSDGPYNLKSTKALADFLEKEKIISTLTLHTNYPVVAYPWGFSTQDRKTAYEELFIKLAEAAVIETHYPIGNSADTIYPANGCYEDYTFWQSGIWSLLFELGTTHSPSASQVEDMIRKNVPGMRLALESMPAERAADHAFKGECDGRALFMDRRDE
ncbi:MAG: M14 family zinc carboxypeptidase [Bdellovibrionota bacterium]